MKIIKKIAAIMFAFMMVVSMSCNVKADDITTTTGETGKITITGAKKGETYKLYKILSLESYSYTENDKDNGNYAYTLTSNGWDSFIKGAGVLNEYFEFDKTNTYLTWKGDKSPARVKEFAQLALKYARNEANQLQPVQQVQTANSETVTYSGLDLGYYLVDSSMGTLCALTTTNPTVEINEKNTAPTVEKKVGSSAKNVNSDKNTASIGDTVYFKRLCHNKQLINSHFYRGVSELPYKLLFAVIYTHLEFRYEVSHTITSHHVHHFHQTRIPDGTLLDYMVQYRKPLFPQFFLYPKKFLPENNPHHKEFHLRPYIQNNANQ